jgi:hypothetical protein
VISNPPQDQRDGPSKDTDPGDSHSGEGVASVRPRLARTLADAALLNPGQQADAMAAPLPPEPGPEPDAEAPRHP